MEGSYFEPSPALFSVVKILSQNGLKKTLKKLRKETNCKKLREEHIPEEIQSLNLEKIIHKKIKKYLKHKLKDNTNIPNGKNPVQDSDRKSTDKNGLIFDKFVKSDELLENGVLVSEINHLVNNDKFESNYKPINNNKLQSINSSESNNLDSFKGKDFRNQKNKKKRSSWKGSGQINECVNSFIFTDSDS